MSQKDAIWALGTMSGTSMDGVDAALVLTDGHKVFEFGETGFRPYTNDERQILRAALGKTTGPEVARATEVVEVAHTELLLTIEGAEIIGFHGQTLWHDPDAGETLQVGDGQVLAEALELSVAWDFRSADVALGGQGAPLAPFYHFALAKHAKLTEPVAFLNIGGVANLTWLDPSHERPEIEGACLAFDTGPGNALMDDLAQSQLGFEMDRGGELAQSGSIDDDVLENLLAEPRYFATVPPKSLDRDAFANWATAVAGLDIADAMATLAAGTAGAVMAGFQHLPRQPSMVLATGGGRKNPALMNLIRGLLPCPVEPVEKYGFNGDMLEAQAFAYLAVRMSRGMPTSAPMTTGVAAPVGGGKISHPILGTKRLSL